MKRPAVFFFPVVVFAALLVYWPGLHGQFMFDDYPNIVLDKSILLKSLALSDLWSVINGGLAGPFGRGMARLSFGLNYYWAGLDPFVFKSTNLAIHVLNFGLIYLLAYRCLVSARGGCASGEMGGRERQIAMFISVVWLLHPIQLLPVLHVVQRMTSLAAFFVLLSMLLYISGRMSTGRNSIFLVLLAWLIFWPLGMLSKETALLFPVFALLWELLLNRNRVGRLDGFAQSLIAFVGVIFALSIWYIVSPRGAWFWMGYQLRDFTLLERLLTEGRIVWDYVVLILFPQHTAFALYHDDVAISRGLWIPPVTGFALISLCAVIAVSWLIRNKFPLVAFGVFWYLAGHSLESSILPLELMHEHRNYLPSFGLFLAGSSLAMQARLFRQQRGVLIILGASFLGYCTFLTALRSHQFGNDLRRSQIEAQHHRLSPSAHIDAGRVLANREAARDSSSPVYSLAIRHFEIASELDSKAKMGLAGMIGASCRAQVPPKAQWLESLAERLHATPFAPADQNVLYYLKEIAVEMPYCMNSGQVSTLFKAAATNERASSSAVAAIKSWEADYYWLGLRNLSLARDSLNRALQIAPENPAMRLKKAQLEYLAGDLESARREMDLLQGMRLGGDEAELFEDLVPLIYGLN